MKAYVFDELYVGMSAEFHREVNDELIHSFGKISGDLNCIVKVYFSNINKCKLIK